MPNIFSSCSITGRRPFTRSHRAIDEAVHDGRGFRSGPMDSAHTARAASGPNSVRTPAGVRDHPATGYGSADRSVRCSRVVSSLLAESLGNGCQHRLAPLFNAKLP